MKIQFLPAVFSHLPKSSRLSNKLVEPPFMFPLGSGFVSALPGCISTTRQTPNAAFKNDVDAKYNNVRNAIRPFIFAFKLAEPAIRLEMISGRIKSFNSRMNNSPGYESSNIASALKVYGRKAKPVEQGLEHTNGK